MAPPSKERFGRYEMVSKLGRGGMAETWRARLLGAAGVTKPVLIKKVLAEYANDQAFISMFISEARISATLSHGNIAQVFDFGRAEGDYFLAMEFVDGQPLHRVLKRALKYGLAYIPIHIAVFIALEMCRGLHYAHTRKDDKGQPLGIVHRDISPDNVLVSYEGQVKIVDFGIAKARALRGFQTEPGVVKGKYLFFSPEQAKGEEVDARTDVWATGIVLYELLCGQMPVKGPQYTAMPKLAEGQFPRPRELRPDLPQELDDIVMRALAVDVDARFASCHAFGDALAGFLYSEAPRFSALAVSHLLQELFREDLTAEGREVQVPRSFVEELALVNTAERAPRTPAPKPSASRSREAPSEKRGLGRPAIVGMVAGGVLLGSLLSALVLMETAPSRDAQPIPRPPPVAPPAPVASRPTDPPPADPPPPAPEPPARGSATYPVTSVRLVARRDLIPPPQPSSTQTPLVAGHTYRLSWISVPPRERPPLFFWLEGKDVPARGSVGLVADEPVTVKGGDSINLFRLRDSVGLAAWKDATLRKPIAMLQAQDLSNREIRLIPVEPAEGASLENAFELKGLDPKATYVLMLLAVNAGAFTRGERGGHTTEVACVRTLPETGATSEPWELLRQQQFLVRQGLLREVSGATGLRCGFLDDSPADNQGELELHIRDKGGAPASASGTTLAQALAPTGADISRHASEALRLLKSNNFRAAIDACQKCIAADPTFAHCHLLLGAALARMGRADEGAVAYQSFLRLAPSGDPMVPRVERLLQDYEKTQNKGNQYKDGPY